MRGNDLSQTLRRDSKPGIRNMLLNRIEAGGNSSNGHNLNNPSINEGEHQQNNQRSPMPLFHPIMKQPLAQIYFNEDEIINVFEGILDICIDL